MLFIFNCSSKQELQNVLNAFARVSVTQVKWKRTCGEIVVAELKADYGLFELVLSNRGIIPNRVDNLTLKELNRLAESKL